MTIHQFLFIIERQLKYLLRWNCQREETRSVVGSRLVRILYIFQTEIHTDEAQAREWGWRVDSDVGTGVIVKSNCKHWHGPPYEPGQGRFVVFMCTVINSYFCVILFHRIRVSTKVNGAYRWKEKIKLQWHWRHVKCFEKGYPKLCRKSVQVWPGR